LINGRLYSQRVTESIDWARGSLGRLRSAAAAGSQGAMRPCQTREKSAATKCHILATGT
jgi:hypothetical protein